MQSWKDFSHQFNNEKRYTQRQFRDALRKVEESQVINRVIMKTKAGDIALKILSIHKTEHGTQVIVC